MPDKIQLEISPPHRLAIFVLLILQYLVLLLTFCMLMHYIVYPLNFLFPEYPSLISPKNNQTAYIKNAVLYMLFWLQHIGMGVIKFKKILQKISKYSVLYERFIFNLLVGFFTFLIVKYSEPSNQVMFVLPKYLTLTLTILVMPFYLYANFQLIRYIMHPFPLKQLLTSKKLEFIQYDEQIKEKTLQTTGLYKYLRHPLISLGMIVMNTSHWVFTCDRVIFLLVMNVGCFVGCIMEEKRMMKRYKQYAQFKEKVKYRFIPYVY